MPVKAGVGYESMNYNQNNFFKIWELTNSFSITRQALGEDKTPSFLGTKDYIDFTDEAQNLMKSLMSCFVNASKCRTLQKSTCSAHRVITCEELPCITRCEN